MSNIPPLDTDIDFLSLCEQAGNLPGGTVSPKHVKVSPGHLKVRTTVNSLLDRRLIPALATPSAKA